ncbi:bifunctional DNA primase/polymerase [Streptomyces sp. NPDC049906]|uniref:bifunctional DNA primase/polymerase n=1 Tax=Streptomyces sp. NPDC049906 TaxID=3155656 RepID=UPI00342B43E2
MSTHPHAAVPGDRSCSADPAAPGSRVRPPAGPAPSGEGSAPLPDTGEAATAGAAWLASAGTYPQELLDRWADRPAAPLVLPCGTVFDVVNTTALFGRALLDRLWGEGPGSGPVATHRGRTLLFAAPGTAHRLPTLLRWEEWGAGLGAVPPLLCHGTGDAVTVPPLATGPTPVRGPSAAGASTPAVPEPAGSRWVVPPAARRPWLPGPEVLVWACVRAARAARRTSISPAPDQGAKVYDVSRRR